MLINIIIFSILGVLAAVLAVGIILLVTKKQVILGRIFITFITAVVVLAAVAYCALRLAFSTVHYGFYSIILLILAVIVTAALCCILCGLFRKKAVVISFLSSVAALAILTTGFYIYASYIDSIPTVGENADLLSEYAPYAADTKAVSLDEPADISFESDFPVMDGATALYPIYSAFAKAVYPKELLLDIASETADTADIYSNEYLRCTTTLGAYESIVLGDADIIFVAAPSKQQQEFAAQHSVELEYTPIGKEAFVFFVNSQNPIENITIDNIQDIYTGKLDSWSQLGIEGLGRIKAFQRPEGSGSQSALIRLMDGAPLMEPMRRDVIDGMGGIISKTADYKNYKNAIGYSFRFYSTEMAANNQIKLLSINGVYPNIENIENGTYPIASDFYAVTRKDASKNTKQLLEWILGEQGQRIISLTGYTPIN